MDQDRKNINALIEVNYPRLIWFAISEAPSKIPKNERKTWARDIVHQAILKTLQHIEKGGANPDNFVSFVKRVIINTRNDAWRKKSEEQFEEEAEDKIPEAGISTYKRSGETWLNPKDFGVEDKKTVEKCLDNLDETPRTILILNYIGGFTTKEISKKIRKPQGSILRWLNQARIAFKTCFEGS